MEFFVGDEIPSEIRRHRQDHLLRQRFETTGNLYFGRKLFANIGLEKQCGHHEEYYCFLHQKQNIRSSSDVLSGTTKCNFTKAT